MGITLTAIPPRFGEAGGKKIKTMKTEEAIKIFGFNPVGIGNRYRGWHIVDEIEQEEENGNAKIGYLAVKTRDGGSNPISADACKLPNFVGSAEDGFDGTYRYYYYAPIERQED